MAFKKMATMATGANTLTKKQKEEQKRSQMAELVLSDDTDSDEDDCF